jgi:hypothetical protein
MTPLSIKLLFAISLLSAPLSAVPQTGRPNAGLPVARLAIGSHALTAEVAATEEHRRIGLMYRFSIPPDQGMLFVHDAPRPLSFWMRNTSIPLSIAFIDANGTIINVEDMAPHDERLTWSAAPALYALEMRKGWFAQRGIGPGAQVKGLPPAAPR